MSGQPDLEAEISNAEEPEAGRHGCGQHQEVGLEGLPAEVGACTHRAVPALDQSQALCAVLVVPEPNADEGPPLQGMLEVEVKKETGRWKSRWKIRDLLADERCSQAVLDFLSTTDVGRLVPPEEEGDAGSEVSEWELRERREREEERRAEAEALGAEEELGGGGTTAVPSFMASVEEE